MSGPDNTRLRRALERFSELCSILVVVFGLVTLSGWAFHVQALKSLVPAQVTVKANTGACFVFIGVALWLVRRRGISEDLRRKLLAIILACVVSVVGLLSFLEAWKGMDFGIDHLLFHAGPEDLPGSVRPGLMSPITGIGFWLLGIAVLLLNSHRRWAHYVLQVLAGVVATASVFGILDYVLNPARTHTHIAPTTALVLFLFSFAVILSRTDYGLGVLATSTSSGGELVRRLLPASILVPVLIAWLRWKGQFAGWYTDWTGVALMVVMTLILLATITIRTALILEGTDMERQRAAQAIRDSERRYQNLIENLPQRIFVKDRNSQYVSCNRNFANSLGIGPEEFAGKCDYDFFTRALADKYRADDQEVMASGHTKEIEEEYVREGKRAIVQTVKTPLRNERGEVTGLLGIFWDVTERKRAEEQLRRASGYTRSLIEASLDPLVTISKDGKITDVNEATEKATGFGRDSLIGTDFSNYFTEPEKARQGYRSVFAEGYVRDYPLALRHTSGSIMHVLYNATLFRNEKGEVEGVFAAARDVTRRKQAEEQLQALNRDLEKRVEERTSELRESESRVRHKLDAILIPEGDLGTLDLSDVVDIPVIQSLLDDFYKVVPVTTGVVDMHGRVLAVSGWQRICQQFHRAHPETCKNCTESDLLLSSGVEAGEFKIYKCKNNMVDVATPIMIGGQHMGNLYLGQFLFADEPIDYEVFRVQARHYDFPEADYLAALEEVPRLRREAVNACIRFLAKLSKVISQLSYSSIKLARSKEEVGRVNEQLTASNKELEAFTYSVSHDLRAPLRHISGFSKILREEFGPQLTSEAQYHLQKIEDGTRRMGMLVDDLLNLAHVGRRDIVLQVTGLKSVVEEVITGLAPDVGGRQIEWKVGELPYVECDTALMRQVFQNLLANAVKFTRPRQKAIVEIGQMEKDGVPVIFVRDNGVGFSMKYADKLFGVFQRLHRAEEFEGTGVGLATVQRIVQKHGGRIWAEAELDKGATFYFTIGGAESNELEAKTALSGATT